jgi:D-serine deaminase-like pyridoxal phosphate-dependent protein
MSAHDSYFAGLESLLKKEGDGRPTAILDLDRLKRNAEKLKENIPPCFAQGGLRLVNKSLPCPELLSFLCEILDCRKQMVFHWPFLVEAARHFPDHDYLFGKPMPIQAAEAALGQLAGKPFDASAQVQWLIDTPERLEQYRAMARRRGIRLRVSLEIDVGLHRGGAANPEDLGPLLRAIEEDPQHLDFAGFLGYDAHVGKLPAWLESRRASLEKSQNRYRAFREWGSRDFPGLFEGEKIFNGGGSPTFLLHGEQGPINEVALGSVLVKPEHFDLEILKDFEPAFYIATPVLKSLPGTSLPGLERISSIVAPLVGRNRTYFIYGGRWLATACSPSGLRSNEMYGKSLNQAILNGPAEPALKVDDWIFLRPQESESVMLQFGDLLAVEAGRAVGRWPVFAESPASSG